MESRLFTHLCDKKKCDCTIDQMITIIKYFLKQILDFVSVIFSIVAKSLSSGCLQPKWIVVMTNTQWSHSNSSKTDHVQRANFSAFASRQNDKSWTSFVIYEFLIRVLKRTLCWFGCWLSFIKHSYNHNRTFLLFYFHFHLHSTIIVDDIVHVIHVCLMNFNWSNGGIR